jgi:hypothetical protein
MTAFLILALAVASFGVVEAATSTGVTGLDVSQPVTTETATCMAEDGINFLIARAWHSTGTVDTNACGTLQAAADGGIPRRDVYMFPCPTCSQSAADQLNAAVDNILDNCDAPFSGGFWLDIEGPQYWFATSSGAVDFEANKQWYAELYDACAGREEISCGVYSSHHSWTGIFGDADWAYNAMGYPLWYPHYDGVPSFSDWGDTEALFGGWESPMVKQYEDGTTNGGTCCTCGADVNWALGPLPVA